MFLNLFFLVQLGGFRAALSEQGVGRGLQPVTFLLNTFNNHSGETPVASYAALPFFVTSQVTK